MSNQTAMQKTPASGIRPGSGAMFDRIAHRYDLLNRLLSLGIDQRWRKKTIKAMNLSAGARVLDVATGTGDLAISIAKRYRNVEVVGLDPSTQMLARAEVKCKRKRLDRVELTVGDAEGLPFEPDSFDATCIAFGIRNVPDRSAGLREMARVTKPGGRVAILELSEPRRGIIAPLARFHVHKMVPWLGGLLSGSKEYRYLQASIAAFPPAQEFADMMNDAGLEVLQVRPLTFGVCHLYVGTPKRLS